jgi:hypothetical protein
MDARSPFRLLWILLATGLLSACHRSDNFQVIQVAELDALLHQSSGQVFLFDANTPEFRAKNGIIPGAKLLGSEDKYDLKRDLPQSKTATLVFYCSSKT